MKRRPPDDLRTSLGRAVQRRRVAMGVSQREIGARCRASQSVVAHIERGYMAPSLGMLNDLSWALNVELSVLFREASEVQQETST